MERELRVPALACPPSVQLPFEYLLGTLKLQDWTLTDDFAGVDIAGLDNGGPDIDGLDIAGLDIDGLDIDGRMRGQLTELKLQNFTR